jgi:hypothetical protein
MTSNGHESFLQLLLNSYFRRKEDGNTQHTTLQPSTSVCNLPDGPKVTVSRMLRGFRPRNTRYWLTNVWVRRMNPTKLPLKNFFFFFWSDIRYRECPKATCSVLFLCWRTQCTVHTTLQHRMQRSERAGKVGYIPVSNSAHLVFKSRRADPFSNICWTK